MDGASGTQSIISDMLDYNTDIKLTMLVISEYAEHHNLLILANTCHP